MPNRCLLDTDILSEVFKGRDPQVVARALAYQADHDRLATSAITVMEMVKGLRRVQREEPLRRLLLGLESCDVLAFDAIAAELAGRIYGDLERTGQTIGRADVMIAATALRHGMSVVTGNTRHYERIAWLGFDLSLDNWRLSP